jgi:hypothetical protein
MRFQVGKLVCELALDESGGVETRWFLSNGRRTEPPKYLDAADRKQYRAGRDAFLRATGKVRARPPTGSTWRTLRRLAPVLVVATGSAVVPAHCVQAAIISVEPSVNGQPALVFVDGELEPGDGDEFRSTLVRSTFDSCRADGIEGHSTYGPRAAMTAVRPARLQYLRYLTTLVHRASRQR